MIHVSCGTYNSISLEIFLNFITCLSEHDRKKIILHTDKSLLHTYASKAGCSINGLNLQEIHSLQDQLCITSLLSALNHSKKEDILLTLPADKSEIVYQGKHFLGHTEFLRSFWNLKHLPMTFITPSLSMLLLTDHLPLSSVPSMIQASSVCEKVITFLNSHPRISKLKRLIFWGINPHAGENKTLGHEEEELKKAITTLEKQYPNLEMIGPIPSDGLFHYQSASNDGFDLIIAPYHDQGLVYLKSHFGFLATNVTFGGPIIRVSPDHGTAVNLLFKKKSLYTSLLWTHQLIKSWNS